MKQFFLGRVEALAGVLVVAGAVGALVGPDLLVALAGVGLFTPLLLREAGVLQWRDEFRREATLRACTHAFIAVGVLVTFTMAVNGFGGDLFGRLPKDTLAASDVLWVAALTWFLSAVLQYWGAPDGAFRLFVAAMMLLLLTVPTRVLLFGTDSSVAVRPPAAETLPGVVAVTGILAWLGILAGLSRKRPRLVGYAVLTTAACAVPVLSDCVVLLGTPAGGWTKSVDVPFVIAPFLLTIGAALAAHGRSEARQETDDD